MLSLRTHVALTTRHTSELLFGLFLALALASVTTSCGETCVDRTFAGAGARAVEGFAGAAATDEQPALSVFVENGAYRGECVYAVRYADSLLLFGKELACNAVGEDCWCSLEATEGAFRGTKPVVRLGARTASGKTVQLDQVTLAPESDSCGRLPERVEFRRPPIENFISTVCEAAIERMDECDQTWLREGIRCASPGSTRAEIEANEGLVTCLANATCDDYRETVCVEREPGTPVTPLLGCVADVLSGDVEELAAYAASLCP